MRISSLRNISVSQPLALAGYLVAAGAFLLGSALVPIDRALAQERLLDPALEPVVPEVTAPASVKDYLITAGGLLEGTLLGCAGESCTIAGTSVPIAETFFIGLGVEAPAPPQLPDYVHDQVVLRDGSVQQGRMVGIGDDSVVTDRGSFARAQVAWLYLFPQPDETAQPDAFGAPEDQPPSEEPPIGEPPGPQDDTADADPSLPSAAPGGERGALWTGSIEYEWNYSGSGLTIRIAGSTQNLQLREYVSPLLVWNEGESRRIGLIISLFAEGSALNETLSSVSEACSQSGSGSAALDGQEDSSASGIWKKFGDFDTTASFGWNIPEGPGTYVLGVSPVTGPTGDTYATSGCEPSQQGFLGAIIGDHPPPWDFVNQFDTIVRTLDAGGGRMTGSYSVPMSDGQLSVSWNVCREGVSCAAPPNEEEETAEDDLCPKPTPQQALLDTGLRQQQLLVDRLAGQIEAYNRLADEARQWQGDFEHATRDCGLWQAARVLTNFLVGNATPANPLTAGRLLGAGGGAAGPMGQAGKELSNFLSMLEKVAAGDASWLLPNHEFNDWASAEDAWEVLQFGYGQLQPESDPARLLDGLRSCGAPTIDAVMDGATSYLRLLQEIQPMMRDAQKTLNDLRAKDNELLDLWNKYRAACLERANCAGLDPASCDSPPP